MDNPQAIPWVENGVASLLSNARPLQQGAADYNIET